MKSLLVALVIAGLAACGGKQSSTTTPAPGSGSAEPTGSATPSGGSDTPAPPDTPAEDPCAVPPQ